jgi:putative hemolysin
MTGLPGVGIFELLTQGESTMNAKIKIVSVSLALSLLVLSACTTRAAQPATATITPSAANITNPASTYCTEKGNRLEIRTAAGGGQYGVCVFDGGSQCDEWAYFRGQCTAASQAKAVETVRSQLASKLNVEASSLQLISAEATNWSDACLGIPQAGETCSQTVTPGFRITFSSAGKQYIYRTDVPAVIVRQEPS